MRLSAARLALATLLAASAAAYAAPLAFDATFGAGGKTTTRVARGISDEDARAVVVQPDGKTVVVGACGGPVLYTPSEICVARYTNAGALDLSFGTFGIFRMAAPAGSANLRAVTLDGTKIVAAGSCGADGAQDFCVLRLNANGTPDTTFGATGLVITPVGTLDDQAHAVAMDGTRILVAGECEVTGSTNTCLARYNGDGTPDATFGTGGKVMHALSTIQDGAYALAVIGGQAYAGGRCGPAPVGFCVIRLTASGALDATWANGGLLYYNVGTNQARVTALAASGSRLLAAGECTNGANLDFCLLRIDSTGQPDTTLNGNGIVIRPMGTGDDRLTGLTLVGSATYLSGNCDSGGVKVFCLVHLTESGGISGSFNGGNVLLDPIGSTNAIAAGLSPYFSTLTMAGTCGAPFTFRDWCITRYSLFGQRDSSLGSNGLVVSDLRVARAYDQATDLLRQPDGKLLAAGTCSDDASEYSRCVLRHNADGTLDASFGTGGVASAGTGGANYDAALGLDSAGRIYAAGGCANGSAICIMRFLANGTLDTTYGAAGIASAPLGAGTTNYGIQGLVVDAAGSAVAGGFCNVPPGINDFCAVKFTPAGALDTGFGTGGKTFVNIEANDNAAAFIADGTGYLVSGDCFPGGASQFCVLRLTAAGQPDPAFGAGNGRAIFPIGDSEGIRPKAAISSAGRLWLAGTCTTGGTRRLCIARLMPDGSLDTSFSTDGKASAPVNGIDDNATAVLPDGTGLLVAGACRRPGVTVVYDFCLARFLADGTLDTAFNDTGSFTLHFGFDYDYNASRGLLRDGNRVIALVEGDGFTLAAFTLLPNDVPRAPTAVVATPGNGQVSVAFTAPSDNGGNPILSYEATCGAQSATGTVSPIVVTGLANGVAVTCTVTATNSAGTGPPSAASASVTPRSPSSVAVSSNANPALAGATVFLSATVTGASPGGMVDFFDGGVAMPTCGLAPVNAGVATCFVNTLGVGAHTITAVYSGDAANAPSTSPTFTQTIIPSGFTLTAGPASGGPGVGNGRVTSSPAGIDCGTTTSNCQASFANGQQVTLTATPDPGHAFDFWFGSCTGSGACVVTMDANKSVSAAFVATAPVQRALNLTRNGTGTGTVTSTPAGIDCGTTCSANFDDGTSVQLAAAPAAGSTFAGWTGGGCSGTGGCTVTMDAAKNVTATFTLQPLALTVAKAGGGGGTVTSTPAGIDCGSTCSANFGSGASVALAAAPAAGSFFAGWSGACTGTGACNVTMSAARNVTATFKLNTTIPRLANISTRMQVLTGADVLIGGFIIGGTQAKTVVVRARGPSLTAAGVTGALANPVLQLFSGATQLEANDNWQQAANAATIQSSGFAPSDPLESAIYTTLNPGAYTAIVTGAGGGTGVSIIEVFEVDVPQVPLLNIATRGKVLTGGDVMIGGFSIQGDAPQTVLVRARGPSLTAAGVPGALQDTVLQLFAGANVIASNDDWQSSPDAAVIQSSGFAPSDARESVIRITLNPGAYTAIVTGKNGTTGVGIIEVFAQ